MLICQHSLIAIHFKYEYHIVFVHFSQRYFNFSRPILCYPFCMKHIKEILHNVTESRTKQNISHGLPHACVKPVCLMFR